MNKTGIGARVRRLEDDRLVHGRSRYVGDIKMPGMSDVAFLRSPLAHARIKAVNKPDGLESRILCAADLDGVRPIVAESTLPSYRTSEHWPLARDKVRFVGEPVAMAIGRNRAEAEDLLEEIDLQLEALPPVVNGAVSMADDAPRLHEEWDDNMFLKLSVGQDLATARENAEVVVTRQFRTARQVMNPMEGKGVVAWWDYRDGQLVVTTSTQVPHVIRNGLSRCLGIDESLIRVIAPEVGGGFGYKCILQPEEIVVAWLAWTRRKPFRWLEDRREHLTAGANTREHQYSVTAYADRRGRLLGMDAEVTVDVGAYSVWPFTAGLEAAQAGGNLPGPYDFREYRCQVNAPATNKPPFTPYRGVARPGVCFAMELTIDAIAREVGREPWEVRADNLVPADAMPYVNVTNKHYDTGDYPGSLMRAKDAIGFDQVRERQKTPEADGRLIGVGFATYTEQSAHGSKVFAQWGLALVPGYDEARIKLTPDGGVEVRVGIQSIGQGLQTTLAQVASEILSIPVDRIRVLMGDTGTTPYSYGAFASRGIVMAGGAVSRAAEALAERIRVMAARALDCTPEQVRLEDDRVHGPNGSLSFAEVGHIWYLRPDELPEGDRHGGLEVTEAYRPKTDHGVFSYASHAVVVAVDPRTGKVELLDYVIVEDAGKVVNPMIVEGQTIGGAVQGIGTALFEEVTYDDQGQPLSSTLADYHLPGAAEAPRIRIQHTESPSPHTAHGIKGVGEGGAIAPGGAIVNAINDALAGLGVEINQIPATPERILGALLNAGAGKENAS